MADSNCNDRAATENVLERNATGKVLAHGDVLDLIDSVDRARSLLALARWVGQARRLADAVNSNFDGGATDEDLRSWGLRRLTFGADTEEGLSFLHDAIDDELGTLSCGLSLEQAQ